jgi:hypothetical protein
MEGADHYNQKNASFPFKKKFVKVYKKNVFYSCDMGCFKPLFFNQSFFAKK